MKRRLLIILGVALAAATASTVIFYKLVSGNLTKKPTAGAEQHSVVVAVRDLPRGSQLRPEDFTQVPWEGGPPPGGTYSDANNLGGRLLEQPVRQGEPVLESQLASGKEATAAAVPPGLRAVSVHVEEYAGVTEILQPGDRVDVLVANGPRQPGNPNLHMNTSLQNIEVFASGRPAEGVRTRASPTVTLLVQVDDVEALTLADHAGAVRLVLRNPLDESTLGTPSGVLSDSMGASRAQERANPARRVQSSRKKAVANAAAAQPVRPAHNGKPSVQPAAPAGHIQTGSAPDQAGNHQVLLEVRFASMGDLALKELTSALAQSYTTAPVILSSFPPGWDVEQAVGKLARQQRLQIFAEPRILALDSTEAELTKNSALPLDDTPDLEARRDGALQLDLDRVGIKVSFMPRVTRPGVIRMRVRSEVTVPDPTHTVRLAGMDLSRVSWRSSECELELLDRQSFWIRGLIDRPGAHDLLRQLFPQEPLQHDLNDELVVLVTPRLLQNADPKFSALQR
jgi:pilus assembly protein CpaB